MKPGRGSNKGHHFEWETCRALSLALTNRDDKKQLVPTRSSGGWQGNVGAGNWRHVGDIAPNGPLGEEFRRNFAIECKHHREISFWHVWTTKPGNNLLGWWRKLVREIAESDRPEMDPLVIFKMNNKPTMVATRPDAICQLPTHPVLDDLDSWDINFLIIQRELLVLPFRDFLELFVT